MLSSSLLPQIWQRFDSELSKVISPLQPDYEGLTETELIRRLGGTAGVFWAALHRFTQEQPPRRDGPCSPAGRGCWPISHAELRMCNYPQPCRICHY